MSQNIYDNKEFFESYNSFYVGNRILEGPNEWECAKTLLPDLQNKNVCDLGCGNGWFLKIAYEMGSKNIDGYDLSENMIMEVKELIETLPSDANEKINGKVCDLSLIDFKENYYDFVFSSYALHYLEDLNSMFKKVYNSLHKGGVFLFIIEHPIRSASNVENYSSSLIEVDGKKVSQLSDYLDEGKRLFRWLNSNELVQKFHKKVSTYINTLIQNGFTINQVEEWKPTERFKNSPVYEIDCQRPSALIIKCMK